MPGLRCPTCDADEGYKKMTKHLRDTGHFSVVRSGKDTIVKCQICHWTGIHDLALVQLGTRDLMMLCDVCRKYEIDTTQVCATMTIENKELLAEIQTYFLLCDKVCRYCSKSENIMIHKNTRTDIVCQDCALDKGIPAALYLRRGLDDGFLFSFSDGKKRNDAFKDRFLYGKKLKHSRREDASATPPVQASPKKTLLKKSQSMFDSTPSTLSPSISPDTTPPVRNSSDDLEDFISNFSGFTVNETYSGPKSMAQPSRFVDLNRKKPSPGEEPSFENFSPLTRAEMMKLRTDYHNDGSPHPDPKNIPDPTDLFKQQITEELGHVETLKKPQLKYESLFEYFRELCDHLYLEDRLRDEVFIPSSVEYNGYFTETFKLEVPYTDKIDKMVKRNFKDLDFIPFFKGQSLFVGKKEEPSKIYHCFICEARLNKEDGTKTSIDLLVEFYFWNDTRKPIIGFTNLFFVIGSPQVTRIMNAMLRMQNPLFTKLLLGQENLNQNSSRIMMSGQWAAKLNSSQTKAVEHALSNDVTVIQGPPGTGKTTVIYRMIVEMLAYKKYPIVVVAASNFAIDNIAEKFMEDDYSQILRITSKEKETEYGWSHKLAKICLHHQVTTMLPQSLAKLHADIRANRAYNLTKNQYWNYMKKVRDLKREILQSKKVIFATTVAAGGPEFEMLEKIPVVIMDEATQSSEAASLIPLSMRGVEKFVFVGDEKQLSSYSEIPYLEQSLFERVLQNGSYPNPCMLQTQYRMHPAISEFPNKHFYDGKLQDGVTPEQRSIGLLKPLAFVHCTKSKEEVFNMPERGPGGLGMSYINRAEAETAVALLWDVVNKENIPKSELAVITPYSGQRDLIARLIQVHKGLNPTGAKIEETMEDKAAISMSKPATIKMVGEITVSSIDAFQGREKRCVIMSCVRSNKEGKLGFFSDKRRLNVALTRAKSAMIIFGDMNCLVHDKTWKQLLTGLARKRCIVQI